MANEYIKRELAINKLLQCADDYDQDYSDITVAHATSKIKEIPAADVVEVVRCRDCRWRHDDSYPMWLPCVEVETDPDWFCAGGERREVQDGD